MQLRDVMTTNVQDIEADATLMQAAAKMKALDVGAIPVSENDRVIGMITDRDIAIRAVAEGRDPRKTAVRDAMTQDLTFCYADDSVEAAAKLMEEKQVRRLPVFDRGGRAIGIVSLGDVAVRNRDDRLSGEVLVRVSEPAPMQA
ncbi:MAG: CBS domain-containing protein [Tepidisphaeraceae bacterium]